MLAACVVNAKPRAAKKVNSFFISVIFVCSFVAKASERDGRETSSTPFSLYSLLLANYAPEHVVYTLSAADIEHAVFYILCGRRGSVVFHMLYGSN